MNNKNRNRLIVATVGLVTVTRSFAQTAAFDPTTATAGFSGAAAIAAVIVGGLVTLGAGLMVYNKIRSYFGKAK